MTHHDHDHDHKHDHNHKHDHDHDHNHDHEHQHDHHHGHEHEHDHHHHEHKSKTTMSDKDKLAKLLDHWVTHNNDHADNYSLWSGKAEELGLEQVARLLKDAADLTHAISDKFIKAKSIL
jgi:hypothetical protein